MKNHVTDLRNHLFATIEALLDKDKPMEIDRARAIAEVAQTAINSAKMEVDYLRIVADLPSHVTGTGFIDNRDQKQLPGYKT